MKYCHGPSTAVCLLVRWMVAGAGREESPQHLPGNQPWFLVFTEQKQLILRVFDMCVWDMPANLHFSMTFGCTGGLLTIL